ncbi:MAG: hypothetical protein ACRED4_07665 [Brevundimonas sp.]
MDALFEIPAATASRSARPETKWTERMVLDLLLQRYAVSGGNGPRYAFAEHVRSQVGHDAPRTADFIAMSLWASDGMALHGHEVKVSRADWLTELRDPTKAAAFQPYMHHWWLVVSDKSIVRDDLPDDWGLMAPRSDGRLAVARRAPRRDPEPLPATLTACILRATAKTAQRALVRDRRGVEWVAQALGSHGLCEYGDRDTAAAVLETFRQAGGF